MEFGSEAIESSEYLEWESKFRSLLDSYESKIDSYRLSNIDNKSVSTVVAKYSEIQDFIEDLTQDSHLLDIDKVTEELCDFYRCEYDAELKKTHDKKEKIKADLNNIPELVHKEIVDLKNEYYADYSNRMSFLKNSLSSLYLPIYEAIDRKEDIDRIVEDYGLTISGFHIEYGDLTIEELKELSALLHYALTDVLKGKSGVSSVLYLLYWPLYYTHKEDENITLSVKVMYLLVLVTASIILGKFLFPILLVIMSLNAFSNIKKLQQNEMFLSSLFYIVNNFDDFDNTVSDILADDEELLDIEDAIYALDEIDIEAEIQLRSQELLDELKALESNPLIAEMEQKFTKWKKTELVQILDKITSVQDELETKKSRILSEFYLIENEYKKFIEVLLSHPKELSKEHDKPYIDKLADLYIEGKLDENLIPCEREPIPDKLGTNRQNILKKYWSYLFPLAPPGIPINASYELDTRIKFHKFTDKDDNIYGYSTIELPYNNLLLPYNSDEEKDALIDISKLCITSLLGNVREKFFDLIIVDPERMGMDYVEFKSYPNCEIVTTNIKNRFIDPDNGIMAVGRDNNNIIGSKSIHEYNKMCEEVGKSPIPYRLVVVVSTGNEDIYTDKVLRKFLTYSQRVGIWMWVLHPTREYLIRETGKKDTPIPEIFKVMNYTLNHRCVYTDNVKGERIALRDIEDTAGLTTTTLEYSTDLGKRVLLELEKTFKVRGMSIIDYDSDVRAKFIPPEKVWTYNTIEGVELNFGFKDGDKSNFKPFKIGCENLPVHGLIGGGTGMGKSVLNNMLIMSLLLKYSPEWLELYLVDFKNVEFNLYTNEYSLPHVKLIAGTTDGEYANSVFEFLIAEMQRRIKMLAKYKLKNTAEWNKLVLKGELDEPIIPTGILLCDEFQVMFSIPIQKLLDQIEKNIRNFAKLARATDMHLLFTSQSMSGTLKDDVLSQFALRGSLGVGDAATSEQLIGNPEAFTKVRQRGRVIINESKGAVAGNNFMHVPFAPTPYIKDTVTYIRQKAMQPYIDARGIHRDKYDFKYAEFYDESTKHKLQEVEEWYDNPAVKDKGVIILGKQTYFSPTKIPTNFLMSTEAGSNIFITGGNDRDVCNLINTVKLGFEKNGYTIGIASYNTEFDNITNWKTLNPEYNIRKDGEEISDILNKIKTIVDKRSQITDTDYPQVVFILAGLDLASGLGIAENYKTQDLLKYIVQKCTPYKVTLVITGKNTAPLKMFLPFCGIRLVGLTSENDSNNTLDTSAAFNNLPNDDDLSPCAYIKNRNTVKKFKIYDTNIDMTKVTQREIFI